MSGGAMTRSRLTIAALIAALVAGCSPSDGRQVLVVYSPHGPDLLRTFEERFETQNPDVDVQWLDMGSQEVLDRVRSERANPQADVWFGGPSQLFHAAAEEGLLQAFSPTWSSQVADYSDEQDRYQGVYLTPLIIAYNSEVVDSAAAPQDWDDFLDERWTDEILIRDPVASGTMRTLFGMVIQRSVRETGATDGGFDWLRQLDARTREYVLNPTLLYQKLSRREGLVTLWDMPDIEALRATTDYPIDYLYASSGTPLVEDAIAVVNGSANPELAGRFVEFIGEEGEVLLAAREFYRLPARTDIPVDSLPPELRRARDLIVPEPIDWQLLHERGPEWMRYWDENVRAG
ncbi:MAG: extracellular solute-binding protein [Gemmatimonas sp.]|nr:extracellular solute-binding protein [Gemmatimonas sp.]